MILLVHRKFSMTSAVILCIVCHLFFIPLFCEAHDNIEADVAVEIPLSVKGELEVVSIAAVVPPFHSICIMFVLVLKSTFLHMLAMYFEEGPLSIHDFSTECAFSKKLIALAMLHCRS